MGRVYGVDYGHAEVMAVFGEDPRKYSVTTIEFKADDTNQNVKSLITKDVKTNNDGSVEVIDGTEKEWPADLVILAMGFVSPEHEVSNRLGLNLHQRNNYRADYDDYRTDVEGIFAAGDCRRGQSLVVWAINEGRGVAEQCNTYLLNKETLDSSQHMSL